MDLRVLRIYSISQMSASEESKTLNPHWTLALVRRVLRDEPELWLQRNARNRWFCPHCGEIVNEIVVPPGSALGLQPDLPNQILDHLNACKAVQAGIPAQKRLSGGSANLSSVNQALHDARLRQRHTMRSPPKIDGFEIGCMFRPMEAVGGDFYEFVKIPDGRIGIGIGDASGHGVEACMLAAVTKKLMCVFGRNGVSPKACLGSVNRDIFDEVMQGVFISAEYVILDPASKLLTYSRAGHPPPIIFNPKRDPQLVQLNTNGLALGVDRDQRFERIIEEGSITLQAGDLLILYTDGITEVKKADESELGIEGLTAMLKKYNDRPLDDMLGQIWYSIQKYFQGAGQSDDITMVAIKVLA
jgi:serine phosphatase RsbU (regulator of sigma subunit)